MAQPTDRGKLIPILLVLLGALLLVGAGVWFFFLGGQEESVATPPQANIPYPEVPRALLDEAKQAYDNGSAVFVDVRGEQYYQQTHIAGAFSLPEDQLPARLGELNPQDWIITYCT